MDKLLCYKHETSDVLSRAILWKQVALHFFHCTLCTPGKSCGVGENLLFAAEDLEEAPNYEY